MFVIIIEKLGTIIDEDRYLLEKTMGPYDTREEANQIASSIMNKYQDDNGYNLVAYPVELTKELP